MASVQRLIKSGIRLYEPRGINFATSSINRLVPSANPYRSLSSDSCGDGHSILSNVKRAFTVDTFAMVDALKASGIPLKHAEAVTSSMAEVLAELEKDAAHPSTLLKSKFESLRKNIKKMGRDSAKDVARVQHSPKNCDGRLLIDEFTPQSAAIATARLNQRIDEETEAIWEEIRRIRSRVFFVVCFLCGNIMGAAAGFVYCMQ